VNSSQSFAKWSAVATRASDQDRSVELQNRER